MNNWTTTHLTLSLLAFCVLSSVHAVPPNEIRYQAVLTDDAAVPLDGTYDLRFSIWSDVVGGAEEWSELRSGFVIANGAVDAILGEITPLLSAGFDDPSLYLQVEVDGAALSPRQKLASVPYALSADRVGDLNLTEIQSDTDARIAGHSLDEAYDAGGAGAGRTITADSGPFEIAGTDGLLLTGPLNMGGVSIDQEVLLHSNGNFRTGFGFVPAEYRQFFTDGVHMSVGTISSSDGSTFTQLLRLDANGQFGVGVADPTTRLHVGGKVLATGDVESQDDLVAAARVIAGGDMTANGSLTLGGITANPLLGFRNSLADPGAEIFIQQVNNQRLQLVSTGGSPRLGIGRNPTSHPLEVQGNAAKTGGGSWATTSDANVKTDVATIEDAIATLDRMRFVSFRYSDEYRLGHSGVDEKLYFNVIAQEYQEVLPDDVHGSGEYTSSGHEILMVDPYPITIFTAAAVQDLNDLVQVQQRRIERQESVNEELRSELESLRRQVAALAERN